VADAFRLSFDVLKVNEKLGLVFGWGMVCSKGGKPYRDTDRERITTSEMLKSVTEFSAESERPTDEMHDGEEDGTVVFSFPVTDEIAKTFGFSFDLSDPDQVNEGWMVAVKPSSEVLAKFADGTYTGFSVGGGVEGWDDDSATTEVAA
jgi:hypothetical protein